MTHYGVYDETEGILNAKELFFSSFFQGQHKLDETDEFISFIGQKHAKLGESKKRQSTSSSIKKETVIKNPTAKGKKEEQKNNFQFVHHVVR